MLILLAAIAAAVPRSPCADHVAPTLDLTGDLRGADLACADLRHLDLRGVDLTGAELTGAWLHGTDLRGATLIDAQLYFAHLEGADLREADLTDAYLRRAVLREANLSDAVLDRTDLCWVDLTNAAYITTAQTDRTVYCRSTLRPDELFRPDDEYGWHFKPFFREPRVNMVTVNSLDRLGLTQYVDLRSANYTGDVRLFDDLGTSVGVGVLGAEFVPRFLDASHRHTLSAVGLTLGLGFGSGQVDEQSFTFVSTSVGPFVQPVSFLQLEAGVAVGATLNDTFASKVDVSAYYGVRVNIRPLVAILDDLAEAVF